MAAKSQKVIIKIGSTQIMLPDDTGAAQVVKALSKGIVVWHYGGGFSSQAEVQVRSENLEVSMTYLPPNTVFKDENDQPLEPVTNKRRLLAPKAGVLELTWKGGRGA